MQRRLRCDCARPRKDRERNVKESFDEEQQDEDVRSSGECDLRARHGHRLRGREVGRRRRRLRRQCDRLRRGLHPQVQPVPARRGIQRLRFRGRYTAVEDCEKKLGPPPGASTQNPDDPEILQSSIALAECLRNEGYDVKDPEPGKGLSIDVGTIPQEAIEKCAASAVPSSASEVDQ